MERYFTCYQVEIINEKFELNGNHTEKSAMISLFDDKKKLIENIKLGYVKKEEVFDKIDKQIKIDLSSCFIDGFSLSKYRSSRKLDSTAQIELNDLNCENAFFGSSENDFTLDFDFSIIGSVQCNFKNSIFAGAVLVSFENCVFQGDVYFDYALFNYCNVSFSINQFSCNTVSFKNSIFKDGLKRFENNKFECKQVVFTNSEFGEGDIIFSDSNFANAEVNFKVSRFGTGRIDFNKIFIGRGGVSFEKVEFGDGNVNFRSASFGAGLVDFTRSVFGTGDISFIGTNFEKGEVSFAGTEFGDGKVTFKQTFFGGGKVDFHYAHFGNGDITFERNTFQEGIVDFRAVDFGVGKILFNRSHFGPGEVVFEACELKGGRLTFKKTVFSSGIFNFEMADFKNAELIIEDVDFGSGKVSFRKSKFGLLSLESSQMDCYFDLRVEECGKLDLSNAIVKDIIDIDSADFKTNIKALDLSGIRLLGRIFLDWRQNNVRKLILGQKTSHANHAAQFRVLKQNYNLNGQYEYEDEAYVEFKRSESKSILADSKSLPFFQRLWAKLRYLFQLVVFDRVGLYATNPVRVLASMTFVYIGFSVIYIFLQLLTEGSSINSSLFPTGDPRDLSVIQKAFYHSAVTFLTIGYGDYYPAGSVRWLSGVEGFTGLFLMSYFTVAFVRKILR